MSERPVLVTGATGNVGGAVLERLTAAGVFVRAAAGSAAGLADDASLQQRGISPVVLDFTDPATGLFRIEAAASAVPPGRGTDRATPRG